MPLNRSFIALKAAALLFLSLPVFAQQEQPAEDFGSLLKQSSEAYAEGKYARFYTVNQKLHKIRPFEFEFLYNIVRACALLERSNNALHYMLEMQKQGFSHDFDTTEDTRAIRGSEAYEYINKLMIEAGKPAGEGAVAARLPGIPSDYGAIAWDESRQALLVGTIGEGKLFAVGPDGTVETLLAANADNGMWSIFGMAVDARNGRLWVSSHATTKFESFSPVMKGGGVLLEFALDSLELKARYEFPQASPDQVLGKLAATVDGHVYVIDQGKPVVYRKTPGSDKLLAYVTSKDMVRFTDIAVSPDNGRIFVADEIMGVFIIDPVAQQTTMLTGPENLNLGGISGIEYRGGTLFLTQGGFSPQRLLRLDLDQTGAHVEELTPVAIALEPFEGPGVGTLGADQMYYIANAMSPDPAARAIVMQSPLTAGTNIVPADMRLFQEQMKQKQNQQQQQQENP
jgi:hypothetical protein